jgi:hypothetical protein
MIPTHLILSAFYLQRLEISKSVSKKKTQKGDVHVENINF